MVKVVLENLTKRFANTVAADDISLTVEDEEFYVLLGPSGGGKSTLLNLIAGLEPPDAGHVYFDGQCVDGFPPEKRDVAMVFQSYALYPHMNIFDNIAFGLKMRKTPRDEIKTSVKEAAAMLGISGFLERKPHQLSGGERQRVALARAIVRKPKVFLLDEPMSNVDAKLRVSMRVELIKLQKALATTSIYVTHDQIEAMTMADRVAIIQQGKIRQIGDPISIYEKPASMFVAGFIGTPPMNFLDCSLQSRSDGDWLEAGDFKLKLSHDVAELVKKAASSSELVLGIRPQFLSVHEKPVPGGVECEVYAVEHLGSENIVNLMVGGVLQKAVVPTAYHGRSGDKNWASLDDKYIHIIDKKTENCIV